MSDQVRKPATLQITEGVLVTIGGLEDSSAHTPTTVSELSLASGGYVEKLRELFDEDLLDWFGEVVPYVPESPGVFTLGSFLINQTQTPLSRPRGEPVKKDSVLFMFTLSLSPKEDSDANLVYEIKMSLW